MGSEQCVSGAILGWLSGGVVPCLYVRTLWRNNIREKFSLSTELSTRLKSEYRRNSMSLNENVMAELAAGGTYFHNSNDLNGGSKRLATAPEYLYMLEFSIGDVKKNGACHPPEGGSGSRRLTVQSRPRLLCPTPPEKKK